MERYWHLGARTPWRMAEVFPRAPGPFIRAARDATEPARELVVGQWGLVPWFAKSAKLSFSTNNARFEEISTKASFKQSWQHGRRCIIPALSFDEPNWESGRNVWWRFRRADGAPWGLAGLWNTWTDRTSGVVAIERADVDSWLFGTPGQAAHLVRLTPVEKFQAAPA